jgi:hypothetical protein
LFRHVVTSKLIIFYHVRCHWIDWNDFALPPWSGCNGAAEKEMKIYLLMALIGALLTAVHFTSTPKQQSETLPQ